jgi:hypothetical protein
LPPQQTSFRLSLGKVQINRPIPNPEQLWAMPVGQGIPPVDLCNPGAPIPPGSQAPEVSARYGPRYHPGRRASP